MEELLNKLIEKGWKPRGIKHKIFSVQRTPDNMIYFDGGFGLERCYDFRQLTSKESGLRQFCCENKMVKEDDGHITRIINLYKSDESIVDGGWDYHYWLMICSILDESELEQFLLDNIKIEGNEK